MNYIGYYRVSTRKQLESGLSLEWQKKVVNYHVKNNDGILLAEFEETETGTRKRKRVEIYKAIDLCKQDINNSCIIVAKMDRLSRDVEFTYSLLNSKVKFLALDCPQANELTIGIMSVLAQEEARTINRRNKAAIETKRARGITMGYMPNLEVYRDKGLKRSLEVRKELYDIKHKKMAYHITDLAKLGWNLTDIVKRLNDAGYKTYYNQVKRLYLRYR